MFPKYEAFIYITIIGEEIWSQSLPHFVFLRFPIFDVKFECLLHIEKSVDNKLTLLNSRKMEKNIH